MSNFKDFMKKNGFYVALVICVMAAAAASVTAVGTILENIAPTPAPDPVEQAPSIRDDPESIVPSENERQDVPVEEPRDDVPTEDEPVISGEPLIPVYKRAVDGAVSWAFSGDELVKSSTMNDWRTHNGTDYLAEDGEVVRAVYSGEVIKTVEDPLWGKTVEIKLDSGYVAVYAGLKSWSVAPGDRVSQGDAIGEAGNTSILESADSMHLHLEIKSGDSYIDPESLF